MVRFSCMLMGVAAAAIFAVRSAIASPLEFESGVEQTALLELYTSEGCSSCPPAEAWISRLKDSPQLWKSIVPVAFHVDYWDYLGWHDPWAAKAFSDRQRAYAAAWGNAQIYTPGFVLDGREWMEWRGAENFPKSGGGKTGVLRAVSTDGREWKITFAPAQAAKEGYEVHAALLGGGLQSNVRAGENSGRRLQHDFVALALMDAPMQNHSEKFDATVKFSADSSTQSTRLAVAVWVTQAGEMAPLQAAGGWIAQ